MPELPPFSELGSRANPRRVKALLSSEVYRPIRAMYALMKVLEGHQKDLLSVVWPVTWDAAQAKVKAAGYNHAELAAALAVTMGTVAPPQ
jgi:hypothetical protein